MTQSQSTRPTPEAFLFEVAWEVCNQLGGIYTVLRTKIPAMIRDWGENYVLVGPYHAEHAVIEFEECAAPEGIHGVLERLESLGVPAFFGRWLVQGRPYVILLDFRARYSHFAQDKYFLWTEGSVSTDGADSEVNEMVAFGSAVFELFRAASGVLTNNRIVAQFHEWMAGVAIPRIRYHELPVATVFTTHATLLGRHVASENPNFYEVLPHIDPEPTARRFNILAKYLIERMAAQRAHVFTTISEVTANEAEKLLGRRPDIITPNGINVQRFAALHEFQNLHLKYKERIQEFVMGHFFPSYTFDIDRTLYLFISGRYEYRNKGMDLFIESLARLNGRLKELTNPPTVVAFVITKAGTKNVNVAALQNHLMFEELKNICAETQSGVGAKLLNSVARGALPSYEDLLSSDLQTRLKRAMHALKRDRLPPIVTHDMIDDAGDAILRQLRHCHLFNQPGDPVKVVFHPDFITATSPIINLDYDQFVRGCHLGVFPSYYEPWGYTPLECIALGLPTVTTDLSGFGTYVQRHIEQPSEHGIHVLGRAGRSFDSAVNELTVVLYNFVRLTRRERIELRNRAERLSDRFDWMELGKYYRQGHELALTRV